MSVLYSASEKRVVPLSGRLFIVNREGLSHWQRYGMVEERTLIEWVREFLGKERRFVDIGANIGVYSFEMAAHCQHVYAFEAQRSVFYRLCGGIALNQFDNITAYQVALGSPEERGQEKKMAIMSPDQSGASLDFVKISNERIIKPDNFYGEEVVKMACLDDYPLERVDLIKIDVEGHELPVLKGSVETLRRNNWPRILLESWHEEFNAGNRTATISYLESLGYEVVPIRHYQHMLLATRKS